MPRGVKNTNSNTKKEIAKVREQDYADNLLRIVAEYQQELNMRVLDSLITQPARDIEFLQAEYRASKKLIQWLTSKVNDGKRASRKLEEE